MPRTELIVTEQMTEPIDFALLTDADGDGIPETGINLSAADHVVMKRKDKDGTITSFSSDGVSPKLSFPSGYAAAGSIQFTPGTADLVAAAAPYQCQFEVYVTATRWYAVPESSRFTIGVLPRLV